MSKLYQLTGNRPSSLPTARYCPKVAQLGQGISSRLAVSGTIFHAMCSGEPHAHKMLDMLTDAERADLESWHQPLPVRIPLPSGYEHELLYADANVETPVGVDADGNYVAPGTADKPAPCLTAGTCDLYWVYYDDWVQHDEEKVTHLFLADLKKTKFAAPDGPTSLQLVAYAMGLAGKVGADYVHLGIWDCTEGAWEWSDPFDVNSFEWHAMFGQVAAAAENTDGEYVTGSHCANCWERTRCPAWLLPAELATIDELKPLTEPEGLDKENALHVLLLANRLDTLSTLMKDNVKAYVRKNGPIVDLRAKKQYREVRTKGRESVSVATLRKAMGEDAEKYISQGKPYNQLRWTKL